MKKMKTSSHGQSDGDPGAMIAFLRPGIRLALLSSGEALGRQKWKLGLGILT
jgi:hypothetical protein